MSKTGRNDPCPCGSGLKYKKCCLNEKRSNVLSLDASRLRKIEDRLAERILGYMMRHYGELSTRMARDEFFCWPDEIPDRDEIQHEMIQSFTPWFIYNWEPDLTEFQEALGDEAETVDLPPMENPARRFLRTERDRLSMEERHFIELSCAAQFSFLKVLDVRRGQGMDVEDMLTGERFFVQDRSASQMAYDGMFIFGRALRASEQVATLAGSGMMAIPPADTDAIIELRRNIRRGMDTLAREENAGLLDVPISEVDVRKEWDIEIRELYHRIADILRNPPPPVFQNTDGEDIVPCRIVYELDCTPWEALDKLATLCDGDRSDKLLNSVNAELDESGELKAIDFPWLVRRPASGMLDNTVNGHLRIDGHALTVDVNSHERATAIQRKIKRRLGRRATLLSIEEPPQTSTGSLTDAVLGDAEQQELMSNPAVRQQIEAMSERHWENWLDHQLPALDGQTPREAAHTPEGLELLDALFDDLAYRNDQRPDKGPMSGFKAPIGKLRKQLGLA